MIKLKTKKSKGYPMDKLPKFKPKKIGKGIDAYMLKGKSCRKVLNAKDLEPCQQHDCSFFKDLCKPCKDCGSQSKIVNIRCKTCFDCENTPNSLRFDNKEKCGCDDKPTDKYKQAEEELALKQELMGIMMKIQEMQNKSKDKGKGKKRDVEAEEQCSVPSYLG
jgi:hypothetical protein